MLQLHKGTLPKVDIKPGAWKYSIKLTAGIAFDFVTGYLLLATKK